jgi:hypothetical protein
LFLSGPRGHLSLDFTGLFSDWSGHNESDNLFWSQHVGEHVWLLTQNDFISLLPEDWWRFHVLPLNLCRQEYCSTSHGLMFLFLCRHTTKEMMCMQCLEVQPVSSTCATPSCNGFSMAQYFCSICNFFDNDDRCIYWFVIMKIIKWTSSID